MTPITPASKLRENERMTTLRPPPPPSPVSPARIVAVPAPLAVRYVPAHPTNYSAMRRLETRFITIHCTDGCEGVHAGRDVAAMFAAPIPRPGRPRSAHYVCDAATATRCVPDALTAWHCGHTGNALSVGVELCGRAGQTRAQWFDADSLATLCIAARVVADLCQVYDIDPVLADVDALRRGDGGITTHACVSAAWHESTHTDPGPEFPMVQFVTAVRRALAPLGTV